MIPADELTRSEKMLSGALRYGLAALICIPTLWFASEYASVTGTGLFLFALCAVLLSAWYGGLGAGLTTAVVYTMGADFFLLPPYHAFGVGDWTTFFQLSAFVFLGCVISWFVSRIRASGVRLKTSTAFLDALLTNAVDGISAQRRDGSFLFINDAGASLAGFASSSEALNLPMNELSRRLRAFRQDGSPIQSGNLPNRLVFVTKRPVELTFRLENVDTGAERWINLKSAPLIDKVGEVRCAVNIFRDVTATKRREAELARLSGLVAEQNRRYEAIMRNMPGPVWEAKNSLGGGQRLVFISPHVEAMLGYTVDELLSDPQRWQNIIHPDDRERVISETARFREDGDSGRIEYRVIARDSAIIGTSVAPNSAPAEASRTFSTLGERPTKNSLPTSSMQPNRMPADTAVPAATTLETRRPRVEPTRAVSIANTTVSSTRRSSQNPRGPWNGIHLACVRLCHTVDTSSVTANG